MAHRLTDDFSTESYWTAGLDPLPPASTTLPDRPVDVAVIGGGYAGLSAAITLAAAGREVVVIEAERINSGAAARAAGSLSHVPKASLPGLAARYGRATADAVYAETRRAREYVEDLIRHHQIDCRLRSSDRFVAAHSAKAFAAKAAALDALREAWGEVDLVPREEQRRFIGSDAFHGGVRVAHSATLQPAMLQRGLARVAANMRARLAEETRVTAIEGEAGAFTVQTVRGPVKARDVVLAVNAQTGALARFAAIGRHLVTMPAYALATEPLTAENIARVLPINGPVSDTYKIINYIAPSEEGDRLIVSARAGRSDGSMRTKAERMFAYFAERFPDLGDVKVSHCWTGRFAVTSDWIPHAGTHEGVHYVAGCNGTGIPMATYLGHRTAERILGQGGATPFDRPPPAFPLRGLEQPFLPVAVRAYAAMDRLFH